jgi:D-tyrosyl-tRNA(Tyr) deacylase
VGHDSVASIGRGFLVLVGVRVDDGPADGEYIADKIVNLRVFEDDSGKMNLSLADVGGEALIVSQFTLYGDCRKGRRPSFTESASGDAARSHYESVCRRVTESGIRVQTGVFGAMMEVSLINEGPVTVLLDSRKTF